MKLIGEVILNEDTMHKLRCSIRAEVIEEIKNNGNTSDEIMRYMVRLNPSEYVNLLITTIMPVLNTVEDESQFSWTEEKRDYRTLKAIAAILSIPTPMLDIRKLSAKLNPQDSKH